MEPEEDGTTPFPFFAKLAVLRFFCRLMIIKYPIHP